MKKNKDMTDAEIDKLLARKKSAGRKFLDGFMSYADALSGMSFAEYFTFSFGITIVLLPSIIPVLEKHGVIMMISEEAKILLILGAVVILGIAIIGLLYSEMIREMIKDHCHKKFEKEVVKVLKTRDLSWEDILIFAKFKDARSSAEILEVLSSALYKELLKIDLDEVLVNRLKEKIAYCKKKIPFENLPENISKTLIGIKNQENATLIDNLVSNIQIEFNYNFKEVKSQKRLAILGLVIGLISLLFAGYEVLF